MGSVQYDEVNAPLECSLVLWFDWFYVMPWICLISIVQFLARFALNYASALGLQQGLHLDRTEYNIIGCVLVAGYGISLIFQSVFLLKHITMFHKYFSISLVLLGVVLGCSALSTNVVQLSIARMLLGLLTAGIYPSLTLFLSRFYRRDEQVVRMKVYWICEGVSLMVGGLISYGVSGFSLVTLGLSQWQWVLIIFGVSTATAGVVSFFALTEQPLDARYFNAEQQLAIELREQDSSLIFFKRLDMDIIKATLREWQFRYFSLAYFLLSLQNGAMTIYSTQLTISIGFNSSQSALLGVASGASMIVFLCLTHWLSRRLKQHLYIACGMIGVNLIGLILFQASAAMTGQLYGFCLMWSNSAAIMSLLAATNESVRGIQKSFTFYTSFAVCYTLGNIAGPWMVIESRAFLFHGGMAGFIGASAIAVILLRVSQK